MQYQQQEIPLLGLLTSNSVYSSSIQIEKILIKFNHFRNIQPDMLHFPAVPKDVELVQPLTDVLLLVALLTDQLLTLSLKQFLSI